MTTAARMKLDDALREALTNPTLDTDDLDEVVAAVHSALAAQDWHPTSDCPDCNVPHCVDPDEHRGGATADLYEAVQMLHHQAHNGPTEPLDASRCLREPCVTVAVEQETYAETLNAFAPGSRVA